ncbi:MAG: hypothetical protein SOZ27_04640 [Spirochaetia bacterium]|nr:hypothetical protein [Spirochaetia bacterium]
MMKADTLGFKLADGKIFPLLDLKKQDFAKVELQAADKTAGKVNLHFVLTKKGTVVEEYPEPLSLAYDPDRPDDLILHAVRSGSNYISVSLFLRKNPESAVKMPLRILSEEELKTIRNSAFRQRRRFLKAVLGFFSALAACAAVALLAIFIFPSFFTGGLL